MSLARHRSVSTRSARAHATAAPTAAPASMDALRSLAVSRPRMTPGTSSAAHPANVELHHTEPARSRPAPQDSTRSTGPGVAQRGGIRNEPTTGRTHVIMLASPQYFRCTKSASEADVATATATGCKCLLLRRVRLRTVGGPFPRGSRSLAASTAGRLNRWSSALMTVVTAEGTLEQRHVAHSALAPRGHRLVLKSPSEVESTAGGEPRLRVSDGPPTAARAKGRATLLPRLPSRRLGLGHAARHGVGLEHLSAGRCCRRRRPSSVPTLDFAPPEEVVSRDDQMEWHHEWLRSREPGRRSAHLAYARVEDGSR